LERDASAAKQTLRLVAVEDQVRACRPAIPILIAPGEEGVRVFELAMGGPTQVAGDLRGRL
jgi:hypothetical protein